MIFRLSPNEPLKGSEEITIAAVSVSSATKSEVTFTLKKKEAEKKFEIAPSDAKVKFEDSNQFEVDGWKA